MSRISLWIILISVCVSSCYLVPANRICLPGPPNPYPSNPSLKNCLIIGDSVSIGYTPWVTKYLESVCQVQHAPWDVRDGGALDTKYGLECLTMFLSTATMEPTHYDAIVFNFGLHDVDYTNALPEEYTPIGEYITNLGLIKNVLLSTGAQVGFITSTPLPYNATLNDRVKNYNMAATEVMRMDIPEIKILDLYSWVVMVCGPPPYEQCSIAGKQPSPHYTEDGYRYIGEFVTLLFESLLKSNASVKQQKFEYRFKSKHRNTFKYRNKSKHSNTFKYFSYSKFKKMRWAPNNVCEPALHHPTSCPAQSTCIDAGYSVSGYGCCLWPDAVNCDDGHHCCPNGMTCDPSCNRQSCKCITDNNI